MHPFHQFVQWVNHSTYKLDLSGVVGLLGGNTAADALETIHLYENREWAGWYNYPGALTVAKKFGQMADSRVWDSLFPGPNESPAVTFNLAGRFGPSYSGALSGTYMKETKHLGHLIMQECAKRRTDELKPKSRSGEEGRKSGSSATVTVISLPPNRHNKILQSKTRSETGKLSDADIKKHGYIPINPKSVPRLALWAVVPSIVSIAACALCILAQDFLCASLILLGIICSGVSSIALGMATLNIHVPVPSPDSPPGDGLLLPSNGNVIVLRGPEADVNIITKGDFELEFSHGKLGHDKHHMIGFCCLLLMTQFLAQLLLMPLSTFFGQILYLLSFIASGVYHLYVVSHERDKVQRELLLRELSPCRIDKWKLGTRTQMAVLVCLILGDNGQHSQIKPEEILKRILPNETPVWECWRGKVLKELALFWESGTSSYYEPSILEEEKTESEKYARLTDQDKKLLDVLLDDARCVLSEYPGWRDGEFQREQVPGAKTCFLSAICLGA